MLKQKYISRLFVAVLIGAMTLTLVSCESDDDGFPQGGRVTDVDLNVNQATYTGTCPHDFQYTGTILTSGAGVITYIWERNTGNVGPLNVNLPIPGGIVVQDTFRVTASGTYVTTLHVTEPNDISSGPVSIQVICQATE